MAVPLEYSQPLYDCDKYGGEVAMGMRQSKINVISYI
jgi:hypothetical protein